MLLIYGLFHKSLHRVFVTYWGCLLFYKVTCDHILNDTWISGDSFRLTDDMWIIDWTKYYVVHLIRLSCLSWLDFAKLGQSLCVVKRPKIRSPVFPMGIQWQYLKKLKFFCIRIDCESSRSMIRYGLWFQEIYDNHYEKKIQDLYDEVNIMKKQVPDVTASGTCVTDS